MRFRVRACAVAGLKNIISLDFSLRVEVCNEMSV